MYMNLKPSKHKKIISFNTTNMTSFGFIIVGTLPKIESLGGGGRRWGGGHTIFC